MFTRAALLVVGIAVGALSVGGVALANGIGDKAESSSSEGVPPVAVDAPNARLAVLISGGTSTGSFFLRRQVGVAQVSNPDVGVFCIKPTVSSGVKPSKAVPIVSAEYTYTVGFDSFAMWDSGRTGCPTGNIQVNTFDSAADTRANSVSFTVVVP